MFPGRIGALRGARRRADDRTGLSAFGVKMPWLSRREVVRQQQEAELERLKHEDRLDEVKEFDLYE